MNEEKPPGSPESVAGNEKPDKDKIQKYRSPLEKFRGDGVKDPYDRELLIRGGVVRNACAGTGGEELLVEVKGWLNDPRFLEKAREEQGTKFKRLIPDSLLDPEQNPKVAEAAKERIERLGKGESIDDLIWEAEQKAREKKDLDGLKSLKILGSRLLQLSWGGKKWNELDKKSKQQVRLAEAIITKTEVAYLNALQYRQEEEREELSDRQKELITQKGGLADHLERYRKNADIGHELEIRLSLEFVKHATDWQPREEVPGIPEESITKRPAPEQVQAEETVPATTGQEEAAQPQEQAPTVAPPAAAENAFKTLEDRMEEKRQLLERQKTAEAKLGFLTGTAWEGAADKDKTSLLTKRAWLETKIKEKKEAYEKLVESGDEKHLQAGEELGTLKEQRRVLMDKWMSGIEKMDAEGLKQEEAKVNDEIRDLEIQMQIKEAEKAEAQAGWSGEITTESLRKQGEIALRENISFDELERLGINATWKRILRVEKDMEKPERAEARKLLDLYREDKNIVLKLGDRRLEDVMREADLEDVEGLVLGKAGSSQEQREKRRLKVLDNLNYHLDICERALAQVEDLKGIKKGLLGRTWQGAKAALGSYKNIYARWSTADLKALGKQAARQVEQARQDLALTLRAEAKKEKAGRSAYNLSGQALLKEIADELEIANLTARMSRAFDEEEAKQPPRGQAA